VEEFIFEEVLAEYEPLLSVLPVDLHIIDGQDLLMVFQTPLWNSIILLAYNTGSGHYSFIQCSLWLRVVKTGETANIKMQTAFL
jgi:hypothetical protein